MNFLDHEDLWIEPVYKWLLDTTSEMWVLMAHQWDLAPFVIVVGWHCGRFSGLDVRYGL